MRIIGGKFRGRVLAEFKGNDVRPTSDRAKESLFNILALNVREARALDLFSGSGALGLECLSRGAKEVVFNDLSKDSVAILKKNLAALKLTASDEVKIYNYDYAACLETVCGEFDLIFIDPPYHLACAGEALDRILKADIAADGALIVCECGSPDLFLGHEEIAPRFEILKEARYSVSYVTILKLLPKEETPDA